MTKELTIKIEFCNCACPYFYHNFYDDENIWCSKLNKKIKDIEMDYVNIFNDMRRRPIPKECPLDDAMQ